MIHPTTELCFKDKKRSGVLFPLADSKKHAHLL